MSHPYLILLLRERRAAAQEFFGDLTPPSPTADAECKAGMHGSRFSSLWNDPDRDRPHDLRDPGWTHSHGKAEPSNKKDEFFNKMKLCLFLLTCISELRILRNMRTAAAGNRTSNLLIDGTTAKATAILAAIT